ncbi:hypothetical protein EsDP_00006966 [Epichloe bromicola]|uniref:AA1-like domain-containing protein n=1 Tax=Epichloe bromicola TaxID=79588 RepID=A0ABQ0CZM1_9HYPO
MKAIAILSLCSAAALASARPPPDPAPVKPSRHPLQEDLKAKNLSVRKEGNGDSFKVTSVKFDLVDEDNTLMECNNANSHEPLKHPYDVLTSGYCKGKDDKYTFVLLRGSQEGGSDFTLSVSHETGPGYGYTGNKDVPTNCIADGTKDSICTQVEPVDITIRDPFSNPNP